MSETNGQSDTVTYRNIAGGAASIFRFDGHGDVTRDSDAEASTAPMDKGFVLIVGSMKEPAFLDWLRTEADGLEAAATAAPGVSARCQVVDDKALIVMRLARPAGDEGHASRHSLGMWIERGRLVIVTEVNVVEMMGLSAKGKSNQMPRSPISFVARMGLRSADRLEPLIEKIGDRLDDIEEDLVKGGSRDHHTRLARLRGNLINVRRMIWPQRDVLTTLEVEQLPFTTKRDLTRLREAANRTQRLGAELQALSERASLVREQIMDDRANETNRAMLILAAVTTIFMPPTLLTGMLGMNVAGIPFAQQFWAFGVVTAVLVALGIGQWLWFRHRRWM